MSDHNDHSRKDAALAASLRESVTAESPQCPSAESWVELIEQCGAHPESNRLLVHMAGCGRCRAEFNQMYVILRTADRARAMQASGESVSLTDGRDSQSYRTGRTSFWQWIIGRPAVATGFAVLVVLCAIAVRSVLRGDSGDYRQHLVADAIPPGAPSYIQLALNTKLIPLQVDLPDREMQRGSDSTSGVVRIVRPIATCLESKRPQLEWSGQSSDKGFQVHIDDESNHGITKSPLITETRWTPDRDLPAGKELVWYVSVDGGDASKAESEQGHIRILTSDETAQMRRDLKAAGDGPLHRGIVMAAYGLTDTAVRELRRSSDPRARTFENKVLHREGFSRQ